MARFKLGQIEAARKEIGELRQVEKLQELNFGPSRAFAMAVGCFVGADNEHL
jgi:hypothetical protein